MYVHVTFIHSCTAVWYINVYRVYRYLSLFLGIIRFLSRNFLPHKPSIPNITCWLNHHTFGILKDFYKWYTIVNAMPESLLLPTGIRLRHGASRPVVLGVDLSLEFPLLFLVYVDDGELAYVLFIFRILRITNEAVFEATCKGVRSLRKITFLEL